MKKALVITLKILGGTVLTLIVLSLALVGLFHTDWVQERAARQVTILLKDYLNTHIEIGYVGVNLFGQDLKIHNLMIEDRQHRKMLEMEELGVELDLWRLLHHELHITEAKVRGLEAKIHKPASDSDSVANFQFIVEAFKSKKPKADRQAQPADSAKKAKLTLDVAKLNLERISVSYNDTTHAHLGSFRFRKNSRGEQTAVITELTTAFVQRTKKGPVDSRLRIGRLEAKADGKQQSFSGSLISIDSLCFFTDNHKPRLNTGKPKRGAFDAGHLDVVAQLKLRLDSIGKDTLMATLTDMKVLDRGSGLNITSITLKAAANKEKLHVNDVCIKMPNTQLTFDHGEMTLPSKKLGRKLAFQTTTINGNTLLKDISEPFSKVLYKFQIPLFFQTEMNGNDDLLNFRNVRVYTKGHKLDIFASGHITGLKNKYDLNVHFDVQKMTTTGKEAIRIINEFPVKKFMMKQVDALGRISYRGYFEVLWKREQFFGTLNTSVGALRFQFALDELNKYVTGTASTDSLELGKAMDMPGLGKIASTAKFRFDISKPRTLKMRKRLGGKLPIGDIQAEVKEGSYKKVKVRNVFGEIKSNGAIAEGKVTVKGKRVDLSCAFSFTNTNEMKKTKIKPGISFHGLSAEDKAKKEADKAAKKAQKDADKAAKKAQKDAEKAQRDAEKAAKKAQKEEEKARKRAEKEARKAAKQAAKDSTNT